MIGLWTVSAGPATGEGERLSAPTPSALWRLIAERSKSDFVHLATADTQPNPDELAAAAAGMGGYDASLGRVRYRKGQRSMRIAANSARRFLATPPGALLVHRAALARCAVGETWDEYWAYDLANRLCATGPVQNSGRFFATADGDPPPERMPIARAGAATAEPLILIYGKLEASVSLYFDGLPPDLRARLRFLRPGDLASDLGWLASAGLVVVVRDFEHMFLTGTLDLLNEIGVPYVWFTDDDLVALGREEPGFRFYSPSNVRRFVAGARAVVATTPALGEALSALGKDVLLWPCVYDADLAPRPAPLSTFRIGVFGGAFRRESFQRDVLPAIPAGTEIIARADLVEPGAAGITTVPFEADFRSFVFDWQRHGLRALVHPRGATGNIANKSLGSVLAAAYLGAVPVVGDEPAYAALGEAEGVLKAAKPADWEAHLRRLSDPAEATGLMAALQAWCHTEFDPEHARAPIARLAAFALPGGEHAAAARWQRACQSQTLRRILSAPEHPPISWLRQTARRFKRWRRGLAGRF